jgi:hypothetical protein
MAASLHSICAVELITIALILVLSCSISLVAAWTILKALVDAASKGIDRDP